MTVSQTEALGVAKNVVELYGKEGGALEGGGLRAKEMQATLASKLEQAARANARQEELKRDLKASTEEVVALTEELYRTASGYLDAAIAAVGKGSEAAKNFQRLRSRVRAPDQGGEAPPAPAP